MSLVVEFDGQDHFKQNGYRGGADRLVSRQKNDNIKTKYCSDNDIKLLRIDYTELKNINEILEFVIDNIEDIDILFVGKKYTEIKHYPDKNYEKFCTVSSELDSFI